MRLGPCCAAAAGLVLAALGCQGNAAVVFERSGLEQPDSLGQAAASIIRGLPAPGAELDHTGALLYRVRATGATGPLCTATLIAPETVVTAKHCIFPLQFFEGAGIDVTFATGPDFNFPIQSAAVVTTEGAPGDAGGAAGYGRDVGVAHLERPLDVTPAVIMPFTGELLGVALTTLGYGVSTPGGAIDGMRRVGTETVAAVSGLTYEALFGDFESFAELVQTGEVTDADILPSLSVEAQQALRLVYEGTTLLEQHEAVTGTSPGDTQSCQVDSGGPLMLPSATTEGVWETYGVVSAGPRSLDSVCDYGQIFATFGPVTFAFLEQATLWTDPCGDVDGLGVCDGTVARRCASSFTTKLRQLEEQDCAELGLACASSESGVGCVSPETPTEL